MAADRNLILGVDSRGAQSGFRKGAQSAKQFTKESRKAAKSTNNLDDGMDRMGRRAKKAAVAVGALATALGVGLAARASIRSFLDFDDAMQQSIAIMGQVETAMQDKMAATAREVAADLGFSASQAAEAYFFLASAGLDAAQSVQALPAVAKFARAGMFDLATATDLATDAQSALGLAVSDARQNLENMTRVTDVLVGANTLANASVQQFSEALTSEAGAALKAFNKDMEEGVAVLAAMADQGVKGAKAGTDLRRVMTILADAGNKNADALANLNIEVFDASGDMSNMADILGDLERALGDMSDKQRNAALEAIGFNRRAQGAILPLLGASDAVREYEGRLREMAGTTEEVSDKQMQSFRNVLKRVGQDLLNEIVPAIETAADKLLEFGGGPDAVVGKVNTALKTLAITAAAGGAVALAPSLVAVGGAAAGATGAFLSLIPAVNSLSAAFALLNIAIGPAGWFIAGLAAVAAGTWKVIGAQRKKAEVLRESEEAMKDATEAMQALNREGARASMENFNRGVVEAMQQVQELERQLAEADRGPHAATGLLEEQLEEARKRLKEMTALMGSATQRYKDLADATDDVTDSTDDAAESTATLTDAMERSLAVAEEVNRLAEDRAEIQERVAREAEEAEEAALQRSREVAAEVQRINEDRERLQNERQAQEEKAARSEDERIRRLRDTARTYEENARAIIQVAEAFGKIDEAAADALQNVAQVGSALARVAGGDLSAIPSAIGGLAPLVSGDGEAAKREREKQREQMRALTDAVESLEKTMRGTPEELKRELLRAVEAGGLDATAVGSLSLEGLQNLLEFWKGMRESSSVDQGRLEKDIALLEEYFLALQRITQSFQEDLQVRMLAAKGEKEAAEDLQFRLEQQREMFEARAAGFDEETLAMLKAVQAEERLALEREQAAKAAEEAARKERQRRAFGADVASREAALAGNDLAAMEIELAQQRREQLAAAQELVDEGVITQAMFDRLANVLGQEMANALEQAREEAERAAQAFRDNLEVRRLEAEGATRAAEQMSQRLENEEEIRRAREQGFDAEMIAALRAVQATESLARARERAAEAAREEARRARELADAFGDLRVRALEALGQGNEAARLRQRVSQQRELRDLPEGAPPELRELTEAVHALERLNLEREQALAAVNQRMESQLKAIDANVEATVSAIERKADEQIARLDEQLEDEKQRLAVLRDQLREQERLVSSTEKVVRSLAEFSDDLLLSGNTILSPTQQLEEARRQFQSVATLARGGDLSAAESLPDAANALLEASREVNASGPLFVQDFLSVEQTLLDVRGRFEDTLSVEQKMLAQLEREVRASESTVERLEEQKIAIREAADAQIAVARAEAEAQRQAVRDVAQAEIDAINAAHAEDVAHYQQIINRLIDILNALDESTKHEKVPIPPPKRRDPFIPPDPFDPPPRPKRPGGGGRQERIPFGPTIPVPGDIPIPQSRSPKPRDKQLDELKKEMAEAKEEMRTQVRVLSDGFKQTTEKLERVELAVDKNTSESRRSMEGARL